MKVKIALGQMSNNSYEISDNVDRLVEMAKEASEKGAEMIGFPELALTPFFPVEFKRDFSKYCIEQDNILIDKICEAAKKYHIHILFGYAEKDKNAFYNSALCIDNEGKRVLNYRKAHIRTPLIQKNLKSFEKLYFLSGNTGYPVVNLKCSEGILRTGIQICYDRHFPEGFRQMAMEGADLIWNLTAAGESEDSCWMEEAWELLLKCRALENNLFLAGVNKTGEELGRMYYGHSIVISPVGPRVLIKCDNTKADTVEVGEINTLEREEAYLRIPYIMDMPQTDKIKYNKGD